MPCAFACGPTPSFGQNFGIRRPRIGVQYPALVGGENPLPPSRSASAATGGKSSRFGHRWHKQRSDGYGGIEPARPSTCFCGTEQTTTLRVASVAFRPAQERRMPAALLRIRLGGGQCLAQGRKTARFFSQAVTVPRDTPKVRARPRIEIRSW